MIKPPSKNPGPSGGEGDDSRHITVHGDIHVAGNDIAELRRLADSHPELAQQVVADRMNSSIIESNTERLGMVLAVILGVTLIGGAAYTFASLGWWQSMMFIGVLLGISHVLRTLLKGEFSDTGWFSQILGASKEGPNKGPTEPKQDRGDGTGGRRSE